MTLFSNEEWRRGLRWFAAEFTVVVSGILVALALQAWWTARIDRRAEVGLLRQMAADLTQDSAFLSAAIYTDSIDVALARALALHLDARASFSDTLGKNFRRLGYAIPIALRTTQYETLKSRGLELVRDDSLRSAITKFYEVEGANVATHNTWVTAAEARWMPPRERRLRSEDPRMAAFDLPSPGGGRGRALDHRRRIACLAESMCFPG